MAKEKPPGRVIFSDLDGTLLDSRTHSWKPAGPALKMTDKLNVPVVFCSGMSRKEIEEIRKSTGNKHPFIAENGGAIFIPHGYFEDKPAGSVRRGNYHVIVLKESDKGLAVKMLTTFFNNEADKPVVTMGIGDSVNDLPMLRAVHVPYLMIGKSGKHASNAGAFIRIRGSGPEAWNRTITGFLSEKEF